MFTNSDIIKTISEYLDIENLHKLGQAGVCKIDYINLDTMLEFIKKYPKIRYMPRVIRENKKYENICDIKILDPKMQIEIMEQIKEIINKQTAIDILLSASSYGELNVVEYLHKNFSLTKEDIHREFRSALHDAARYGHLNIVEYLHKNVGLTKDDLKSGFVGFVVYHYNHQNIREYINEI